MVRFWIQITVHSKDGSIHAQVMIGDDCVGEGWEVPHKLDHPGSAQGTAITKAFLDFQQKCGQDIEVSNVE